MKRLSLILIFLCMNVFAVIPQGRYKVTKIQCKTGYTIDFGKVNEYMNYSIYLDVGNTAMAMIANAQTTPNSPIRIHCEMENRGSFTYTQAGKYEGELLNTKASCNSPIWTNILKKRLWGVEEYGVFNYHVNGPHLTIYNEKTITKYKCTQAGDYPIYHYQKI